MSQFITPDPEQCLRRLNASVDAYLERTRGQRPHGTKTWLAQQLSCDRTTLYKYLDGTNRIPLDTLQTLVGLVQIDGDSANTLLFLGGYGVAVPVTVPPPPAEPVITTASLKTALANALPEVLRTTLGDQLSLITGLLEDIRKDHLGGEDLRQALAADPALAELGKALAGREVRVGSTVVSFGVGSQMGDVRMRDIAGRDLVQLTLHTGNVYHFYNSQVFIGEQATSSATSKLPAVKAQASQGPITPNPFGRRGRIDNPAEFFGRDELLRRIFEELGKGSNLSLIGEREVGKSSLLYVIHRRGADRLGLPAKSLLQIDMQVVHSEDDFFEALCAELDLSEPCRGYRLARQLRGKHYILCLDEIEKMRRDRFSADVRDELRGLADGANAPLTLVVASGMPLAELFPDKLGEVSPLANICSPLDVPPFTRAEARGFLEARLGGTGVTFDEDEVADLLERSGRHPARLQQAAAVPYREKRGV